jgi:L-lactate dehydrogenase (cytochrome)
MEDATQRAGGRAAAMDAAALELMRRFPTALDLRERARWRMPRFAFDYMDGGAGADAGVRRNWDALDAVELAPRYGRVVAPPPADCVLFCRPYSAPLGVAPIGGPGTAFPGAETYLARASQAARTPYTLGVLSGVDVESAARMAPDVLWFQLYRFASDGHRIGLDLARRAQAAGVHALVLTIDTPIRTIRPREVKAGIVNPFKLTMRLRLDAARSPWWTASLLKNGIPRFASLTPYMKPTASLEEAAAFIKREQGGAFTWEEIAKYRDVWKGPLVLKGALHPADAQRAAAMGVDGLFVTNHGGRQIDALPASIDALPAVRTAAGDKMTIIFDSGVRSGVDVARAIACGADAAFAGKSFLWSLGALGAAGPGHLINVYTQDLRAAMGQLGCRTVADLRGVARRHKGAWTLADYEAPRAPGDDA